MKRIKRLFHARFFDRPTNIALLITCLVIVCIQMYFLFHIEIRLFVEKVYTFTISNSLILVLIPVIIPLLPKMISYFRKIVGIGKKKSYKLNEDFLRKTVVFPGTITCKDIENNDVMPFSKRSLEKKHIPIILDRKNQIKQIVKSINEIRNKQKKSVLSCLYLTGKSGAGKSILLEYFLKKELENKKSKKWKCLYFNQYNKDVDLIYKEIIKKKARIVIMDQFETTIQYTDIYNKIESLVRTKEIIFIFSFPQNFYDKISNNISKHVVKGKNNKYNSQNYFLQCDAQDIKQLKILVNTFLKVGVGVVNECLKYCEETFKNSGTFLTVLHSERYPVSLVFMCSILARIRIGNLPLVEFSVISYIYELYKEEIDYNIDKYIDELDKIFALYLDKWVDEFPNPETGKIILQLISDGRYYNFDDLKCVTFENKELFEDSNNFVFNIKKTLERNQFIKVKDKAFGFKNGISTAHDYIAEKMNEYCFENLDNEIRQNVDYYKKKMTQNNYRSSMQAESSEKLVILNRYNNFTKKYSKLFIEVLVYILMVASIAVSFVNGSKFTNSNENIYYIFIGISTFLATFYMYNIVVQFFRVLKKRYYYPLSICGVILIISCYLLMDFWGVFIGLEIVILGVSLFAVGGTTVGMARSFFKNKGILYIVLGVFVIAIAVIYVFNDNLGLRVCLSVFFVFYAFMSNVTHISYGYIINKVGRGNTISQNE